MGGGLSLLNISVYDSSTVEKPFAKAIVDDTPLSSKTVVEHHRLISTILASGRKRNADTLQSSKKSNTAKSRKYKTQLLSA